MPAQRSRAQLRRTVTCLVNDRRRAHGLRPLRTNVALQRAATRHSISMVRRDFFSHYGNGDFVSRIRRAGYLAGARSWRAGEVIATGRGAEASPRGTVQRWMHSSGHRAQILSAGFRHLGVGVAHGFPGGGPRGATYTIDLGYRSG